MIINIDELKNFKTNHSEIAERAVQQSICNLYGLKPGRLTEGYNSNFDFIINDKTFELKISSKGVKSAVIELARADGGRSGLTATKSDFYMFLNNAGNKGKIRLIKTLDLKNYYSVDRPGIFYTKTVGDQIGSKLVRLDLMKFNDLMLAECDYDWKKKEFNTDTFISNTYAKRFITNFIR